MSSEVDALVRRPPDGERWEGEDEEDFRSRMIDEAIDFYLDKVVEAAAAKKEYRRMLARSWPMAKGRTGDERKDQVESIAADAEELMDVAAGLVRSANEIVKHRQEQFGMLRTKRVGEREIARAVGQGASYGA